MRRLSLAPCVDLAVFYAADSERFIGDGSATLQVVTPQGGTRKTAHPFARVARTTVPRPLVEPAA